jgi:hypothetical protein
VMVGLYLVQTTPFEAEDPDTEVVLCLQFLWVHFHGTVYNLHR